MPALASDSTPALIPLSLLEAIRNLDAPVEDGLEELAEEVVVRRLGLSQTVAAQIQRYRQAAERDGTVATDEVLSVLRLVGRRPDAALVFADAGRRAARYAARARRPPALLKVSPTAMGRRLVLRATAQVARSFFGGDLSSRAPAAEVSMTTPLSVQALPDGAACSFYSAVYNELLRYMLGFEGAMAHERCRARGDEVCLWRAVAAEVYD
jgi:bacteriochlorophyll 4-vinyl reductase